MLELIVTTIERLDKYLADRLGFSRQKAQTLIKEANVKVNHSIITKSNFKVELNDKIIILKQVKQDLILEPQAISLDIIFEDRNLLVINKPTGLLVHPTRHCTTNTLVNGLLFKYGNNLSNLNGSLRPGIVHRLDKDTSGLMIIAKNNLTHEFLAKQLQQHQIERSYLAIVVGELNQDILHLELPLSHSYHQIHKMVVTDQNAKKAITHIYKIRTLSHNKTLVKCVLETGRTHQIRAHLAYIKHPIYGDSLYGHKVDQFQQRLHAFKLTFTNLDNQKITLTAPVPQKFWSGL